jgi:uncharacterized membrane protein
MVKEKRPHFMRRTFLAGLLILFPLFMSYVLVSFLFNLLSAVGAPLVGGFLHLLGAELDAWVSALIPLVNLFLALAVIFFLGVFGANILGRRILGAMESFLLRLPLVKTVYGSSKQLVETFQGNRSFQRVVLVQYPRKGIWTLGLVATERKDTMPLFAAGKMLTVFVPTTPNPTSGFVLILPPDEAVEVDYSVEEAFKFIISAGIVGKDLAPRYLGSPAAATAR